MEEHNVCGRGSCNHDHHAEGAQEGSASEDFSTEELVQLNEDKIDALITLLVKKNVITEVELSEAMEGLYEENSSPGI